MIKTTKISKGCYEITRELMTEKGIKKVTFEIYNVSEDRGYTAWNVNATVEGYRPDCFTACNTKKEAIEMIAGFKNWELV